MLSQALLITLLFFPLISEANICILGGDAQDYYPQVKYERYMVNAKYCEFYL